ncbi:DMT family transporter [Hoeflea prorocentri]|uniref:DMT family transporter n=1 Tax=Hoeflea prorocentri TaxID=1922333 RepID=A0A9X3UED1_9HYPH|nr:DMT family transporter [Hoeflea prorocentri]MCY6379327.1 DMT family transporter [Hoeflea prorocentri]MDA5397128.1 DMT family transporter [Hoeflea prorocentri]
MALKAYILLVITTLGWGGNAVAGKFAAGHVSPALLTSGRWLLALLLLLPFALPHLRREWSVLRAHFLFLLGMGIVGFALFNNFYYLALNYTSAINGAIEQAAMPLLVFAANFLLFGQRVSYSQIIGFFISITGVALVATNGNLPGLLSLDVGYGDALLILSISFYGAYTVALRWMPKLHWSSAMVALALGALIGGAPFTVFEAWSGSLILPDMTGWFVIVFAAVFPSIVSQACFIKGVAIIGANRGGLFINLVPIFGTLFAVLLLGEQLEMFHLIALGLVLGGIALAEHKPDRAQV